MTEEEKIEALVAKIDPRTPDEISFELIQRKASLYSASQIVPKEYQGKSGMPNCVVAMEMSSRLNLPVLQVMQNLYLIHGRPSWKAEFVIARINQSGTLKGKLHFKGDSKSCAAWGIDAHDGERLEGETVTWEMVQKFGWDKRDGSMWQKMPGQMFKYRAAAFFARVYCPEALLGLPVEGEMEDVYDASPNSSGVYEVNDNDTAGEMGGPGPVSGSTEGESLVEEPSPSPNVDLLSKPAQFTGDLQKPKKEDDSKPAWMTMDEEEFKTFHAAMEDHEAFYHKLDTGMKRAFSNRVKKFIIPQQHPANPAPSPPQNPSAGGEGSDAVPIGPKQEDEITAIVNKNPFLAPKMESHLKKAYRTDDERSLSEREANELIAWMKAEAGVDVE